MLYSYITISLAFLLTIAQSIINLPVFAQQKDVSYYIDIAVKNNPSIMANERLLSINNLQNELIYAQNIKPQVYLTSDYLFAPYFNNDGRFISITPNPDANAIGFDPAVTNGGFYGALLNVDIPLLNGRISSKLISQNKIQNQILTLSNRQILHDLEKQVKDQYLNTYGLQEQINYLEKIILLIEERKNILSALVQKGLLPQTDYLLLDIEQNARLIEQHQQRQLLTVAFTQLNNICGIDDTTQYEFAVPDTVRLPPVKSFKLLDRYKLDSINIAAQQEVLKTNFSPQLNLFGNVGLQSTDLTNIQNHFGTSIGLHLNILISNGNQKNIQLQQNMISFDTLFLSRNTQMTNVQNSIKGINKQIITTEETIVLNQSQISKQELLLSILQNKLMSGQVSIVEYLKIIEDYIFTNQNLLNAKITLWQLINQYNYLNW